MLKANSNTKIALTLLAAILFTVLPALLHGGYTSRWGVPADREKGAAAVAAFPEQLGEWVAVDEAPPLSERVQRELGLMGYVNHVYRHPETQKLATILLMVGEAGPLVRHPPEICYGNRAHNIVSTEHMTVDTAEDRPESVFRMLDFIPNSKLVNPFRVAYAWSSDGVWSVPCWPRWTFGGAPTLYKVQIQFANSDLLTEETAAETQELLEAFVIAFNKSTGLD